jgi:P4 family phage/plasmid primase-like protien
MVALTLDLPTVEELFTSSEPTRIANIEERAESSSDDPHSQVIWQTESSNDLAALVSLGSPEGHSARCNRDGDSKAWELEELRGCIVYVVHDCDESGQADALTVKELTGGRLRLGWAPAIAMFAKEVRNVVLQPINGKSLKDWIQEKLQEAATGFGLTDDISRSFVYEELLALAQKAELIPNPDPENALSIAYDQTRHAFIANPRVTHGYCSLHGSIKTWSLRTPGNQVVHCPECNPPEEKWLKLSLIAFHAPKTEDSLIPEDRKTDHQTANETPNEHIDDPHRLARVNLAYYQTFGRELKYWNETWYRWKNGQYSEISHDHFAARLNQSIKREFDLVWYTENREYDEWKKSSKYDESQDKGPPKVRKVTTSLVNNVIEATKSLCLLPSNVPMHSWLDKRNTNGTFVAVENGMLNLTALINRDNQNVLGEHSPLWFSTSKLPFSYDPNAKCPRWCEFLEDVFDGDQESIHALQQWIGYLLTPDMSLQKTLFVIGVRRSGKGTIATVIRALLGNEVVATPTMGSLGQPFGLASLVGKTCAMITDARMPSHGDGSIITERLLSITGGDPVDISRKHKTDISNFKLSTRFSLFSNHVPDKLKDASAVFASRCIFLSMQKSFFGREDRNLASKLLQELPGILNWAIEGHISLMALGRIRQPVSGLALLRDLYLTLSPVSMFLSDECDVRDDFRVETEKLFERYVEWCEDNDREPLTAAPFGKSLRIALPAIETKRISLGADRPRWYIGLKLKPKLDTDGTEYLATNVATHEECLPTSLIEHSGADRQ